MREHGFAPPTFTAKNVSGEEIPPYACVQLVPVSGSNVGQTGAGLTYLAVNKPSEANGGPYALNGANKVAVGGYGEFRRPWSIPMLVKLDPALELADAWDLTLGPVDGQWYAGEGSGFLFGGVFAGYPETGFVLLDALGSELIVGIEIVSVSEEGDEGYDADDLTAICNVTTPCETVTDEDEYERITVHDQMMGCLLNSEPAEDLVGRKGWAVRKAMRSDPYCEKKWQLGDLCCPEDV